MRMEANPQLDRFQLAEGHTVLGHSWDHPNLNNIPASVLAFEVDRHRRAVRRPTARRTASRCCRPPFLSVNAATTAALAAMGFTVTPNPISATRLGPGALGGADPRRDRQRAAARRRDPAARRAGRLARRTGDGRRRADDHRRGPRPRLLLRDGRPRPGRSSPTASSSSGQADPADHQPGPLPPARLPGHAAGAGGRSCRSRCGSPRTHSPSVFVRGETGTLTLTVSNPTDARRPTAAPRPSPTRSPPA